MTTRRQNRSRLSVARLRLTAFAALLVASVGVAAEKNPALEALLKKRAASTGGNPTEAAPPAEAKPAAGNTEAAKPAETQPANPPPASPRPDSQPEKKPAPAARKEPATRGPKPLTFEDFDLVVNRNIFDPNRRKIVIRSREEAPPPPPPRNSIVLKGTMKTPDALFASFDSTLSECRGRFDKDQEFGGFKLTAITRTNATLKLDTNVFALAVGESLSKTGDGPWTAAGRSSFSSGGSYGSSSRSSGSSSSDSGSSSTSSSSSSSGGRSAALQRLLEMRKKSKGK